MSKFKPQIVYAVLCPCCDEHPILFDVPDSKLKVMGIFETRDMADYFCKGQFAKDGSEIKVTPKIITVTLSELVTQMPI